MGIDFEELYTTYTDEQLVREANAPRLVPPGEYRATAEQVDVTRLGPEDAERNPRAVIGRAMARVRFLLIGPEGQEAGRLTVRLSWEPVRTSRDQLDLASRLWGQLVRAIGAENESVHRILTELLPARPVRLIVQELWRYPDGSFKNAPADPEARAAFQAEARANGGVAMNTVGAIRRL